MKNSEEKVIILYTSDLHGAITDDDLSPHEAGGLARLRTAIEDIRSKHDHVLLIDNGDLLQGTPLAHQGFREPVQVHPLINLIQPCQFDLAVIGNHDLDYGREGLEQIIRDAPMRFITANILDTASGQPAFGPGFNIQTFGEITIAIIGLTSTILKETATSDALDGLTVTEPAEAFVPVLTEVKQHNPDLILVAYHGGVEKHPGTGQPYSAMPGENQGLLLLEIFPEIDALLSGHQHLVMNETHSSGQKIIQPGYQGRFLGKITIEKSTDRSVDFHLTSELIPVETHRPHADTVREHQLLLQVNQKRLSAPVIRLTEPLQVTDPMEDVWLNKHPLIQNIHLALQELTGAEVTTTPFLYNAPFTMKDQLTQEMIHTLYPYPNRVVVLSLSGMEIKAALEHGASLFDKTASGISISPAWSDPEPQSFHYEMWDGIDYDLDLSMTPGYRVTDVRYQGLPIAEHERIRVATSSYRASGAGGYTMLHPDQIIQTYHELIPDLLIRTWSGWDTFPTAVRQNWRILF